MLGAAGRFPETSHTYNTKRTPSKRGQFENDYTNTASQPSAGQANGKKTDSKFRLFVSSMSFGTCSSFTTFALRQHCFANLVLHFANVRNESMAT